MKHFVTLSSVLLCTLALFAGCGDKSEKTGADENGGNGGVTPAAHHLCPKCGEVAGEAGCCITGVEECSHCKLHAGSPGCCNADLLADKEVNLCSKCGEIAAASHKCNITKKCAKCGLEEDSALCCIEAQTEESVKERAKNAPEHSHEDGDEHEGEGQTKGGDPDPDGGATDEPNK